MAKNFLKVNALVFDLKLFSSLATCFSSCRMRFSSTLSLGAGPGADLDSASMPPQPAHVAIVKAGFE